VAVFIVAGAFLGLIPNNLFDLNQYHRMKDNTLCYGGAISWMPEGIGFEFPAAGTAKLSVYLVISRYLYCH
jgi:hypothetical protein